MNPLGLDAYVLDGIIPCGRFSNGEVADFLEGQPGYEYDTNVEEDEIFSPALAAREKENKGVSLHWAHTQYLILVPFSSICFFLFLHCSETKIWTTR